MFNFSDALNALNDGKRVYRNSWDSGFKLKIKYPTMGSALALPFICMVYPSDHPEEPSTMYPWTPSQLDLFATDWIIP
jgi:hypothetical protein